MTDDTVRDFLRRRGCPDTVVARGLAGLLEQWERTARFVEEGYPFGLDDYLNDMDARQLIEECLEFASEVELAGVRERLAEADARVRAEVESLERCLWGTESERYHGWSAEKNWWYFAAPREPGPDLAEELGER